MEGLNWTAIGVIVATVLAVLSLYVQCVSGGFQRHWESIKIRFKARRDTKRAIKRVIAETREASGMKEYAILIFSLSPNEVELLKASRSLFGSDLDKEIRLLIMHGLRCASLEAEPGLEGLMSTHNWLLDNSMMDGDGCDLRSGINDESIDNVRTFMNWLRSEELDTDEDE